MKKIVILLILSLFVSVCSADAAGRKRQQTDTAALACRGVLENFADVFQDIEGRLDSYRTKGFTHYFYCPSDDRYCNRWGWKFLYSDAQRQALKNLNKLCHDKELEFVWTLNPGDSYGWGSEDYKFLLNKLVVMYYNGIRSFAVDFSGNKGDHHAVRDSLVKDFVSTRKGRVSLYMIDDYPEVAYPFEGHSAVETLMRGYHFDKEAVSEAKRSGGVICRLSASDEFAKMAVAAAADFSTNPYEYSADQSMADAVRMLDGDVREAFITFLRHTGSVEESASVGVFTLDNWSKEYSDKLYEEFEKIERVPLIIGPNTGSEVMAALQPWFEEFGRLGTRGKKVLKCMDCYLNGDLEGFWNTYISAIMSKTEIESYMKYPVGADKLQPFCAESLSEMKAGFTSMLSGKTDLHNLASTLYERTNAALDSDLDTFVNSGGKMEFAIPAQANTCHLLTGPLPEDKVVLFRQLKTDGSLVAEFVVRSPYTTFDLKEGAVMVDVSGDVDIYESIFVYL